ncbi:MAG: hypothetical protein WC375_00285 [Methanomassiliicoccales archaeon]|jgi:hypothetical protein
MKLHLEKFNKNVDLVPEDGSTLTSLKNAKAMIDAYGLPFFVRLHGAESQIIDSRDAGFVVVAMWRFEQGELSFPFSGFSWSYDGEGPRGLLQFLEMARIPGISIAEIINTPRCIDKIIYGNKSALKSIKAPTIQISELPPEGSDLIRDTFGE